MAEQGRDECHGGLIPGSIVILIKEMEVQKQ
jgi:hypothetical protein